MLKPIIVAITALLLGACASQSSTTQSTTSLSNDCQKMAEKIKSANTANTTKSTLNAYYNKYCK